MRYIGIDYGTKRVGVALSDEGGKIAFAKEVFENDVLLIPKLEKLCGEEHVGGIVLGESRDFSGVPNPVMKKANEFAEKLKTLTGLPLFFEQEFLTSHEASQKKNAMHLALSTRQDGRAGRGVEKKESVDASAAAIILQSFLEKNNK